MSKRTRSKHAARVSAALAVTLTGACGDAGTNTGASDSEGATTGETTGDESTSSSSGVASSSSSGTGDDSGTTSSTGATTSDGSTSDASATTDAQTTSGTTDGVTSDSSTSDTGSCPEGTEGCPCAPDEQCEGGLVCEADTCAPAPFCGDGELDPGELCDDANDEPGDGCEADCSLTKDLLLWELALGDDNGASVAHGVTVGPDGEIYVGGTIILENKRMAWIGEFSPDGELQWEYALEDYASSEGWAIARDPMGGLLLAGHASDAGPKGNNAWLGKLTADGELEWADLFDSGPDSNDGNFGVATDYVGDIYVVGNMQPGGPGSFLDIIVRKLDTDGAPLWTDSYGPGVGADVRVDSEGGAVVTGALSITMNDLITGSRAWARKYQPGGQVLWDIKHDPANDCPNKYNAARAVAIDAEDFVHLTGTECLSDGDTAILRQRYEPAGVQEWSAMYNAGDATNERGNGARVDGEGNLLIAGSRNFAGEGSNAFALCTDPAGETKWTYSYHAAHDEAHDVAAYTGDTIILVGGTGPAQSATKLWVARYSPPEPMMMP